MHVGFLAARDHCVAVLVPQEREGHTAPSQFPGHMLKVDGGLMAASSVSSGSGQAMPRVRAARMTSDTVGCAHPQESATFSRLTPNATSRRISLCLTISDIAARSARG